MALQAWFYQLLFEALPLELLETHRTEGASGRGGVEELHLIRMLEKHA